MKSVLNSKKVLLACPGVRRTYIQSSVLDGSGLLHKWFTGFNLCSDSFFVNFLGARSYESSVDRKKIVFHGATELLFKRGRKIPLVNQSFDRIWEYRNVHFSKKVSSELSADLSLSLVHSYSSACGETSFFLADKHRFPHVKSLVEYTSAPRRYEMEVHSREQKRWALDVKRLKTMPAFLDAHEKVERENSDVIVTGSNFVRNILINEGSDPAKVLILPKASDLDFFTPDDGSQQEKLRILVVGSVSLLKGAPYILEASLGLPDTIEINFVGSVDLPDAYLERYRGKVRFHGIQNKEKLLQFYRQADLLIHASLSEDAPNAVREAMACGLPVITAPCAADMIENGITGLILEEVSAPNIVDAVRYFLTNRDKIENFGAASRVYAEKNFTLENYKKNYLSLITGLIGR